MAQTACYLLDFARAALKAHADTDRTRLAQAACHRFMSVSMGHWPGFDEATHALFASDGPGLQVHMARWLVHSLKIQ
jgi:hypothetical protein